MFWILLIYNPENKQKLHFLFQTLLIYSILFFFLLSWSSTLTRDSQNNMSWRKIFWNKDKIVVSSEEFWGLHQKTSQDTTELMDLRKPPVIPGINSPQKNNSTVKAIIEPRIFRPVGNDVTPEPSRRTVCSILN